MRLISNKAKFAADGLLSFVVWTSVLAVGLFVSCLVLQLLLISGMKVYFLVHR